MNGRIIHNCDVNTHNRVEAWEERRLGALGGGWRSGCWVGPQRRGVGSPRVSVTFLLFLPLYVFSQAHVSGTPMGREAAVDPTPYTTSFGTGLL